MKKLSPRQEHRLPFTPVPSGPPVCGYCRLPFTPRPRVRKLDHCTPLCEALAKAESKLARKFPSLSPWMLANKLYQSGRGGPNADLLKARVEYLETQL